MCSREGVNWSRWEKVNILFTSLSVVAILSRQTRRMWMMSMSKHYLLKLPTTSFRWGTRHALRAATVHMILKEYYKIGKVIPSKTTITCKRLASLSMRRLITFPWFHVLYKNNACQTLTAIPMMKGWTYTIHSAAAKISFCHSSRANWNFIQHQGIQCLSAF